MHYIVALTGGIGSGKSTVANAFVALNTPLVDADIIARQVVKPGSTALRIIIERYGTQIINTDASLNRTVLRKKIFSSLKEKTWLNNLLHPLIQQQTEKQLQTISAPYVIWAIPLLIENCLQDRADRVLVIDVDPGVQIARILTRDGVSYKQIQHILAAQASREDRLAYADDIIDNSYNIGKTLDYVTILHQYYLELAMSVTRQDKLS